MLRCCYVEICFICHHLTISPLHPLSCYNIISQQPGELRAQFVCRLVFLHQLLQAFGVVHCERYVALQVAQTLLQIVHTEVVEQMLGLLAQCFDAVLLFDAQLVSILLLVGTCAFCSSSN